MAYVTDEKSLKLIDFQRVRMVDRPRMASLPSSAFGAGPADAYVPIQTVPAETSHPYATMAVCDVQRHLIAAGNPRLKPDGVWGDASKKAFSDWAKQRPLAEARTVTTTVGQALPAFGMRADYKFDGQKIRIPAIYAMSLPPMASVPCSSRIAPGRDAAPPGEDVAPAETDILPGAPKSKTPWVAIGVGVGAAALLGFLWFKSKKEGAK